LGIIFHQQKLKFENLALFSGSLGVKIGFSFELVRLLGKISVVRKEEVEAVRSL